MGRGSMRQRGADAWELRVYQGTDANSGKQRWVTKTVHGSRRHAERCLAELVSEAGYSRLRAGTVADLLERWFTAASPDWAASTMRETASLMRCHLLPHLGHLPVTKLTTADIDDLYGHLLRAGGRDGRALSAGTVHRVHVVLHRALAQAVRWEWIWLNPASQASPPRVAPAEIRPPTPAQVNVLLTTVAATDPALFTYLRLAVSTGARRSQLLALRWAEIDLGRAAIAFTRALVEGPDGPVLAPTKTRRSYRVTLDAESLAVLVHHRQAAEAVARQVGADLTGECFVFSSDADGRRPWLPNALTKRFIRARRDAGLTHFRLHDLRHFMATQMLAAGVPIATVSQRLSHARASTTLNVYAHAVPGGDRDAAETLSAILNEARPDASTAGSETLGGVEDEAGACPGRAQLVVPAAPGVRAGVRDAGRRLGAAAPPTPDSSAASGVVRTSACEPG